MSSPRKKGPASVRVMNGSTFAPDEITDTDYTEALRRQRITLLAAGEERRVLGKLRVRIERGAVEQSARYYFDRDLGIVRRREQEETGS